MGTRTPLTPRRMARILTARFLSKSLSRALLWFVPVMFANASGDMPWPSSAASENMGGVLSIFNGTTCSDANVLLTATVPGGCTTLNILIKNNSVHATTVCGYTFEGVAGFASATECNSFYDAFKRRDVDPTTFAGSLYSCSASAAGLCASCSRQMLSATLQCGGR